MKTMMTVVTDYLNNFFEKIPDQIRKRKLLTWLFFFAVTVFFAFGMTRTKFDMTVEGWFTEDDPTIVAFNGYHAEFGSEDNLFITYKPKDGNVFSAKSLEAVKGIREELLDKMATLKEGKESALKHIVKIKTLINAPVLIAEGDELTSRHLVGKTIPTSQQELDEIRRIAEAQKKFPLAYFSRDKKYGGILIETDFGAIPVDSEPLAGNGSKIGSELKLDDVTQAGETTATEEVIRFKRTDVSDYISLMNEIKVILNKPEYANHLEFYPVGYTAMMEYNLQNLRRLGLLNLGALIIIMILLWFLFRSISAVIWPITIIILSMIWTIGLTGWLGLTVTPFIMLTMMLIIVIGIADAIHILSGYLLFRKKGLDYNSALRKTYKSSGLAMLLTTITTMMGVLALNITPIVPIQVFGLMSAIGVATAFFISIYMLPIMLDLWAPKIVEKNRQNRLSNAISRYLPDFSVLLSQYFKTVLPTVERWKHSIVFLALLIFGICIYGATKIRVDSDPIEQLAKDSPMRENVRIVDQYMTGAQNMEIYLDLGKEYSFQDPLVLNIMDELQQKMEKKYSNLIVRTSSLVDIVKDAYQKLNEGKEEMYIIPTEQNVLSQTLFMFNNANADDRRKLVSDDYSKSHISVQLRSSGSYEYTKAFDLMRKDIDEAFAPLKQKYPDTKVTITGILALMMTGVDYIVWGEIQSFGLALIIISIILLLVFGSFKAGLMALLPNLIPSFLAFGLMGLLEIPLDFSTMMLAPIIIGIALDDTIHCLTHYRDQVLIDGNIKRALQNTIEETGQAIAFSALVLTLGFGIMAFSPTPGTRNTGIFGSLAMIIALLNELYLFPALTLLFKFKFQKQKLKQVESDVLEKQIAE